MREDPDDSSLLQKGMLTFQPNSSEKRHSSTRGATRDHYFPLRKTPDTVSKFASRRSSGGRSSQHSRGSGRAPSNKENVSLLRNREIMSAGGAASSREGDKTS